MLRHLKRVTPRTDPETMTLEGHILVIETVSGTSQGLISRMAAFGIEPLVVPDIDEAIAQLGERRFQFSAVVIPTDLPAHIMRKEVRRLRRAGPSSGLVMVSAGKPPGPDERKQLAAAGLTVALWEPYDDGTLRFQLNRAIGGDRDVHGRRTPRAPTYLLGRVFVGDRTKDAVLYSLSEGGAFLETPRASMDGARVEVELRLPSGHVRTHGTVIFSNVPGNLQRPNLPLGMGVRFEDTPREVVLRIREYVESRLAELNV